MLNLRGKGHKFIGKGRTNVTSVSFKISAKIHEVKTHIHSHYSKKFKLLMHYRYIWRPLLKNSPGRGLIFYALWGNLCIFVCYRTMLWRASLIDKLIGVKLVKWCRGKTKFLDINLSQWHFPINPTWANLAYCSGLCRYMPAINHLSQGRVPILFGWR